MELNNISDSVLQQWATPDDVQRIVEKVIEEKLSAIISKAFSQVQPSEKKEFPFHKRLDTAKMLGVTPKTLDVWTKIGIIKRHVIGKRVYYSDEEIMRVMETSSKKPY